MAEGAERIVAGVDRLAVAWVVGAVTRIVDAWGRLDGDARAATLEAAQAAGDAARARVLGELRTFFALDVDKQRTTPLAIVRTLRREPTATLRDAGIPEVERDEFDTRAFPDDVYGIVPLAIAELGDDELGGALLAWGLGKAAVLREGKNNG
jgi:hypothetical protein